MISKEPNRDTTGRTILNHAKVNELMDRGARRAKAESRRMGVPIPLDDDEDAIQRYELPDGSIVDEDPWHGKNVAPEGWYERFGISPANQPKTKK